MPMGLILFGILITIYRVGALFIADLPLFFDEAYYFSWSQNLDFGYYSKPPLIAWLIAITTWSCGTSELCIRAPALLIHPLTASGIFFVARDLYGYQVGKYAALIYLTLPMIFASSWIISTDVLLLLFWTYSLYFLVRALEKDYWKDWLGLGICLGLGLLSKYTMIAFLLSSISYLLLVQQHRCYLYRIKLYVALFIALTIFLPNLIWNFTHDLISLKHTAQNAAFERAWFYPHRFLEFILGQMLVFGPILSGILISALSKNPLNNKDWRHQLLLALGLPLLIIMSFEAFLTRANANWAAPSYLTLTILIAAWGHTIPGRIRFIHAALALNLFLGVVGYHFDFLSQIFIGNELPRRFDPYARLRGWRELAAYLEKWFAKYPNAGLLGDDRAFLAELNYYLRPKMIAAWNPSGVISDQYQLTVPLIKHDQHEYLFVARTTDFRQISAHFRAAQDLGKIKLPTHSDSALECRVYWVHNFLGYQP